jgi:hypothetical protein
MNIHECVHIYILSSQEKHKKRSENPSMRTSAHAPKANTQTNPQSTQQTEKDFRNKGILKKGIYIYVFTYVCIYI